MSRREENPFERFDLDPKEGSRGITERLRELAEEATDAERAVIRAAWEELTLHPLRRLRAATFAFPPHPDAARTSADHAPLGGRSRASREPPTLAELAPRPSVAAALAAYSSREKPKAPAPMGLDDDPVLHPQTDQKK